MADVRIPPQTALAAQLGRVQSPARPDAAKAEAIKAAQRAFFEAAMGQPQAAAAPTPASKTAAPAQAAGRVVPTASQVGAAEPNRFARPGSLLDIKV